MRIPFSKYHGTGNDFILIDNRGDHLDPADHVLINRLCHRKFGIGADGLMLLSDHPEMDFEMKYFNADGYEGSLCGNGARCIIAFARELGIIGGSARFLASDGTHMGVVEDEQITVRMGDVEEIEKGPGYYYLDTGSPHMVFFRRDVETMNVFEEGKKVRYSDRFRDQGTNVDYIFPEEEALFVRTYERGVENETLSCGTGVVASAICAVVNGSFDSESIPVRTPGGNLAVSFRREGKNLFREIRLTGPVRFVFDGTFRIADFRH